MAPQLKIPLSIAVSKETLAGVYKANPALERKLEETLVGMEPEITSFIASTITPNARLMEKNISDYSYSTNYGLDTVVISVQSDALGNGIRACLESGDLTRVTDFIAAEITEAHVRATMEQMGSAIRWMAKESKKMGKRK